MIWFSIDDNGNNIVIISNKSCLSTILYRQRFAVLFKQLGFQSGDCMYAMTGNSNYIFIASLAIWRLGGSVALGRPDSVDDIADQINESKPSIILVDLTQGSMVLKAIRVSTHATFNSRFLSIGYLNDRCHNILNLIRNIDINFVPEISHPVNPLIVHWEKGRILLELYKYWQVTK